MADIYDEYTFRDITQFDGVWRPKSSLSVPESKLDRASDSRPVTGKSRVEYSFKREDFDPSKRPKSRAATGKYSTASAPTPAPANSQIVFVQNKRFSHTAPTNRKHYSQGKHGKNKADDSRGFCTMQDRNKSTEFKILHSVRARSSFPQPDRTCHAYSAYSVVRDCERLAISPYGEPMLSGATGRYREKYKSKVAEKSPLKKPRNSPRYSSAHPPQISSNQEVFETYFENSIMRNILECKTSAGVLKKPPPRRCSNVSQSVDSVVSKIHRNAQRRVDAVQSTLGLDSSLATEGQRFGVEHQVALLLSARLEHHRRTSSQSELDSLEFMSVRNDIPRFQSQPLSLLTKGEASLREGIQSNHYDEERASRGPTQFCQRRRRSRSPPLSKISRDKFLPEAMLRRQENELNFQSGSDLRIGKPGMTTPVSDWRSGISESTRRPKSTLTTKMRLESVASLSREQLEDDVDETDKDKTVGNDDDVIIENHDVSLANYVNNNQEECRQNDENAVEVLDEEKSDQEENEKVDNVEKRPTSTVKESEMESAGKLDSEGDIENLHHVENDADLMEEVKEVVENIIQELELNQQ